MTPKKPELKLVEKPDPIAQTAEHVANHPPFTEPLPTMAAVLSAPFKAAAEAKGLEIDLAEVRAMGQYLHVSYRLTGAEDNALHAAVRFIAESFQQELAK